MLKAVRDTIIVSIEYSDQSKGGIVIPETAKQYSGSFVGIVHSVGPDYKYDVKPGDKVYIRRHEGFKILHKGTTYFSMRSRWVVGKQKEV